MESATHCIFAELEENSEIVAQDMKKHKQKSKVNLPTPCRQPAPLDFEKLLRDVFLDGSLKCVLKNKG